jgi:hypothetical protein
MIIKVKDKGYVSQPFVAPELTVFYNGRQIENITLSIDKKILEIGGQFEEETQNSPEITALLNMNMHADENFLYIKVGDIIKRTPLSDFV